MIISYCWEQFWKVDDNQEVWCIFNWQWQKIYVCREFYHFTQRVFLVKKRKVLYLFKQILCNGLKKILHLKTKEFILMKNISSFSLISYFSWSLLKKIKKSIFNKTHLRFLLNVSLIKIDWQNIVFISEIQWENVFSLIRKSSFRHKIFLSFSLEDMKSRIIFISNKNLPHENKEFLSFIVKTLKSSQITIKIAKEICFL
jgi:hypothetical protein